MPIEEQIPLITEAGFSHVSLGGGEAHSGFLSSAGRKRLRSLSSQFDLPIDTVHGPQADLLDSAEHLTRVARAAAELGVPVVVTHAGPFTLDESEFPARLEAVLRTCEKLASVAQETGIVFALENVMPGPATDLVCCALRHLDPQHFGFCYDSSHEQIDGPRPFDLLGTLRDRVVAVRLSDRVRAFVDHVPPGEGFVDWAALVAALRATSFAGPLLFEVMVTHALEKETRPFLRVAYERAYHVHSLLRGTV